MSSADLQTVMITCPHCGTRYQVPPATIGADGRDVQCAQCGKNWHATADAPPPPKPAPKPAPKPQPMAPPAKPPEDKASDPRLEGVDDEDALDSAFEAAEANAAPAPLKRPARSAKPPKPSRVQAETADAPPSATPTAPVAAPDAAALSKAVQSFNRRQQSLMKALPTARVRRVARIAAALTLASVLGVGFGLRTDIVRIWPALAGLYGAVGLPVNVIGLSFDDTKTLSSLRNGQTVMQVSAKIRSVAGGTIHVPPVLISLLNDRGGVLYEWTVAPNVPDMEPGEVQDFATEVHSPPEGAVRVRLSFTTKA